MSSPWPSERKLAKTRAETERIARENQSDFVKSLFVGFNRDGHENGSEEHRTACKDLQRACSTNKHVRDECRAYDSLPQYQHMHTCHKHFQRPWKDAKAVIENEGLETTIMDGWLLGLKLPMEQKEKFKTRVREVAEAIQNDRVQALDEVKEATRQCRDAREAAIDAFDEKMEKIQNRERLDAKLKEFQAMINAAGAQEANQYEEDWTNIDRVDQDAARRRTGYKRDYGEFEDNLDLIEDNLDLI